MEDNALKRRYFNQKAPTVRFSRAEWSKVPPQPLLHRERLRGIADGVLRGWFNEVKRSRQRMLILGLLAGLDFLPRRNGSSRLYFHDKMA